MFTRRAILVCLIALSSIARAQPPIPGEPVPADVSEKFAISLSAIDALDALADGRMTSEQYVDILLNRIAAHSHINAVIELDPAQARAAARLADQQRAEGRDLGPLHGLPILLKDSINTADLPTSAGTPALAGFEPENDAAVLRTLREAGAIVLGKTNLHELSFGYTTDNFFTGPTRNPYDFSRIPGGSSGGNAAALAARFAPVAIGEDTGGSVRVPAALTGTMGFRPTTGRYSQNGVVPIASTLDTLGPMARTVEDLALIDAVITGAPAGLDPVSLDGLRVGVPKAYFRELLDPAVEKALAKVLARLEDAGAILVEADIPEVGELTLSASVGLALYEVKRDLENYLAAENTGLSVFEVASMVADPGVAFAISLALADIIPEADYLAIRFGLVPLLRQIYQAYFTGNDLDIVLYPTVPVPAPLIGQQTVTVGGSEVPVFDIFQRIGHYIPLIGAPTVSLPIGQMPDGLPIGGIDVAGVAGDDRNVLAIAAAISEVLPRIRPPREIRPLPLGR